ncbi:unnamed protein product [Durusdinium trenchii]|uniref:Secreted protein n=1 Tax=Durusdinium trenchii TaxID=1381693 RepID=A0ABP0LHM6_9DINO
MFFSASSARSIADLSSGFGKSCAPAIRLAMSCIAWFTALDGIACDGCCWDLAESLAFCARQPSPSPPKSLPQVPLLLFSAEFGLLASRELLVQVFDATLCDPSRLAQIVVGWVVNS